MNTKINYVNRCSQVTGFHAHWNMTPLKFDNILPKIGTFTHNNKLIYIHENVNIEIKTWKLIKNAL